jgi:hypothetical protein
MIYERDDSIIEKQYLSNICKEYFNDIDGKIFVVDHITMVIVCL